MPSALEFYGNHNVIFQSRDIDEIEYCVISELCKIDVPNDILLMEYDKVLERFPREVLYKLCKIENWYPAPPLHFPGIRDIPKENVVTIGPLGMVMIVTPDHIALPSILSEPEEWYSPLNKEKVQIWRSYYHKVINRLGGDHAFYINQRISFKLYDTVYDPIGTSLSVFENVLISKYGAINKSIFDYSKGKCPKYYIDNFQELKEPQV